MRDVAKQTVIRLSSVTAKLILTAIRWTATCREERHFGLNDQIRLSRFRDLITTVAAGVGDRSYPANIDEALALT